MISFRLFPRLNAQNHQITSPPTATYNCIAWAAGDTAKWWQPGLYWPLQANPLDDTLAELTRAFQSLGYDECPDADFEVGFEKVALFGVAEIYTHAARQLPSGKWTSKLGTEDDIAHDGADAIGGGVYGEVVIYMKRKYSAPI